MAAAQNVRFRYIPRDHMRSIPHDPYPWSIPLWRTWSIPMIHTHDPYPWSIPMIHTYLGNCKSWAWIGFVSELYLWDSSVSVSRTTSPPNQRGRILKPGDMYIKYLTRSRLLAIATIKDFMFVLVWWLAICNLKYTWGCEGLWTPHFSSNQPRVIHDWFPFQQRIELDFDSTTKTISQDF